MDPRPEMFEAIMYPTAAFTPVLPELRLVPHSIPWDMSYLNPKNRINSLTPVQSPVWRIDGGESDGTCFFSVPSFAIGRPPLRIDTFIPDPASHPPELRNALSANSAMLLASSEIAVLGISQLILRALENWYHNTPGLEDLYRSMPFGSRIVIDNISSNIADMDVHLIPSYNVELQWLSVDSLQEMWNFPKGVLPESIEFDRLQLQKQLHDAISLVKIRGSGSNKYVFKSVLKDVKYLYHELKMLLSMKAHPNVISPPLYIVTKKCRFGGKVGVCGFILRFYEEGTLRDIIVERSRNGTLTMCDQLRWAKDITSSLIHINDSPVGFYSDLKLNNVVMTTIEGSMRAVIIDFEQRGGWYSWSPPEICYIDYLEYITSSNLEDSVTELYASKMKSYEPLWKPRSHSDRYWNTEHGFSTAWLTLGAEERERAQIFMLGKLLWCLFEGVGSINSCPTPETFRDEVSEHYFPEFRRTPEPLRECIRRCTCGAPEWDGRFPSVVRKGNKLFPRGVDNASAYDTQEAARKWWVQELSDAERFIGRRIQEKPGGAEINVVNTMQATRPSLREVLQEIEMASLKH